MIASPFMPQFTLTRQMSSDNPATSPIRQRQRSQSPVNCNVPGVFVHPRYGSLVHKTNAGTDRRQHVIKLNAIPPIHDDKEEDERKEEHHPALTKQSSDDDDDDSSSSYTRFSELTRKEWATIGMLAIANLCSTVAFSCIAPFYPVSIF